MDLSADIWNVCDDDGSVSSFFVSVHPELLGWFHSSLCGNYLAVLSRPRGFQLLKM